MSDRITRVLFSINLGYPHQAQFRRSFNVGTLRTMLLAYQVSIQQRVPMDVRLWHEPGGDVWPDAVSARVTDAMSCILWSGLRIRKVYELRPKQPDEAEIRRRVAPEIADRAVEVLTRHPAMMARNPRVDVFWDDIFGQDGTLVVSGDERTNFDSYCETWCGPAGQHEVSLFETSYGFDHQRKSMSMVYESTGRPILRREVPIVKTEDGHRMGPLNEEVVWWSALRPVESIIVSRFLLATAMAPDDPLHAPPFCIADLSSHPYVWSWDHWYAFLLGGGGDSWPTSEHGSRSR